MTAEPLHRLRWWELEVWPHLAPMVCNAQDDQPTGWGSYFCFSSWLESRKAEDFFLELEEDLMLCEFFSREDCSRVGTLMRVTLFATWLILKMELREKFAEDYPSKEP